MPNIPTNNTRITTTMSNRNFIGGIQRNFTRKSSSENRIISQRQFTRASQNPMNAARAIRIRRAMSEVNTYQSNLSTAAGIYDVAESAIMEISDIMSTLQEKLVEGACGTRSDDDKRIIAMEVDGLADRMMRLMNLTFAGRRIFGGVNNNNAEQPYPPFRIEWGPGGRDEPGSNRVVYYNGVPVNNHTDHNMFPDSRTSFLDVGLGLGWLDEGRHTIDPQTAIAVTFNGAHLLGSGINEETGFANNLIQLTLDAADSLRAGRASDELTAQFADLLFGAEGFLSLSIARIGSERAFIEFNMERLSNNMFSLQEQQNHTEFIDMAEESITWKTLEMIYNASLQMGASVVPMSVFNFIR